MERDGRLDDQLQQLIATIPPVSQEILARGLVIDPVSWFTPPSGADGNA